MNHWIKEPYKLDSKTVNPVFAYLALLSSNTCSKCISNNGCSAIKTGPFSHECQESIRHQFSDMPPVERVTWDDERNIELIYKEESDE